jgi:hypothetical protein
MRYMAEIVLGPPGGSLAERLGAKRALIAVSLVSAVAYAAIGSGAVWIGVIAVVLLRGVAAPLPALVAAIANPGAVRVPAIAGMGNLARPRRRDRAARRRVRLAGGADGALSRRCHIAGAGDARSRAA